MKLHKDISTTNNHVAELLITAPAPHSVMELKLKRPEGLNNQYPKPLMVSFNEIALKLNQEEST